MQSRAIRFVHRGRIQQVEGLAPTLSVLEWLRSCARQTGTKEGCAEGDCGACTVLVAELADGQPPSARSARVGPLLLRPINACIRLLPTLDGKALLTVEDLAAAQPGASLHPAQQALVDSHATQCGFCTPGFAMTLAACYEQHLEAGTRPTREALADALAGNLCRCTGYRPILDAGLRMFDGPAQRLDVQSLATLLRTLRDDPPLCFEGPDADGSGTLRRLHSPRTIDDLAALAERHPDARLLAGSTDIGLWVNKQFRALGDMIHLGDVTELRAVAEQPDGALHIGAAAPLEDAWQAIVARWPELRDIARRFAGPPVRHAGTMGGNVANGSPIGDSAPVLMALGATLVLRRGARRRECALDDFYLDYLKNRLEPGEWLQTIIVPAPLPGRVVRAWKISKRFDSDISAVLGAFALDIVGETVADARIAFGGMAATVRRASKTEAALRGRRWTQATLDAAQAALWADFTPLSDLRASATYRQDTARALLQRLWLQTRAHDPLSAAETEVGARVDEDMR